jgi:hypothetical protein
LFSEKFGEFNLIDLCAYWIMGVVEEAIRGHLGQPPSLARRLLGPIRAKNDREWQFRCLCPESQKINRWIYLPNVKAASWRKIYKPILSEVQKRRPDVGIVLIEEIKRREISNLSDLADLKKVLPSSAWQLRAQSIKNCPVNLFTENKENKKLLRYLEYGLSIFSQVLTRWLNTLAGAFRQWPPALILVNNDLENIRRSAALLAKRTGIPVVNIQHGLINGSPQYSLGVSDLHLVWGEMFLKILKKCGIESHSLLAAGPVHYDGHQPTFRYEERQSVTRLLYAAQPASFEIPQPVCDHLIDLHNHLAVNNSDLEVVIRFHPREPKALRKRTKGAADTTPNLVVSEEPDIMVDLQSCHAVSTVFSTVALDAVVLQKPVLLLDFAGQSHRFPFERTPPFFEVRGEKDFFDSIQKATAWSQSSASSDKWQEFYQHCFAGLDGQSVKRSAGAIDTMIGK